MDTKQKTRQNQSRNAKAAPAKQQKKKSGGLFGFGKKPAARKKTTAPAAQRRNVTPEEAARRRAAAEARARAKQEEVQQTESGIAADEQIPEMVFKPSEKEQPRIRTPEENKRAEVRRRSAKRSKARQEEAKRSEKRPAVTYTDPVPFNLRRLLLQLAVVVAVVLAIVMGISVFFRVEKVMVYGNEAYSAWQIREKSEIEDGQNLLTFGATRACGKIRTSLPYIKTVRIGIKLPDTVNIYVEEYDVVYAIESSEGKWWLMTSSGRMGEQIDSVAANGYTKVLGVKVESPVEGGQAKAVEDMIAVPQATSPAGESGQNEATEATEAQFIATGAEKLRAALLILDALELNDIVGEASSINVQSLTNLELMYGTRYLVKLGSADDMEKKITTMKQAIAQLNEYQTGILDVSFTTWPDRPGYTPYE